MVTNLFIFAAALFMVIRGATIATKYSELLADNFRLSRYTIGFLVIAVISILPETFIAINSSLEGIPSFGLGMLFGSNIADLTLVFAIIVLVNGRNLKVESRLLKNNSSYPFLLLLPLVLGLDGHFTRLEGLALIIAGAVFYYIALKNDKSPATSSKKNKHKFKSVLMLLFSMALLLAGSHFVVTSATTLAGIFNISPILIGMLVVGLGTTMPELLFSLKSIERHDDSLAIGDILGTVLADATVVVGILAVINPFSFPKKIIYITGIFMVIAAFVLFKFMRSGRSLSKREVYILLAFWLVFVVVEFAANY